MKSKFNILLLILLIMAAAFGAIYFNFTINKSSEDLNPFFYTGSTALALFAEESQLNNYPSLPDPIKPLDLDLQATQIFDLRFNYSVLEINTEKRWPLASLTKLMTAVVSLENLPAEQMIVVSQTAIDTPGIAGNFSVGEKFTVNDLVKAIIAASSNDAAAALAEAMPDGELVRLMNKKAAELNMQNTYFNDPSGLSFLNQSTPTDLVRLVKYIYYFHPDILEISRQLRVEIIEAKSNNRRTILNINQFADRSNFLGGKTGFTDEAQGNLISIFDVKGHPVLFIVFGALNIQERFVETEKLLNFIYERSGNY